MVAGEAVWQSRLDVRAALWACGAAVLLAESTLRKHLRCNYTGGICLV